MSLKSGALVGLFAAGLLSHLAAAQEVGTTRWTKAGRGIHVCPSAAENANTCPFVVDTPLEILGMEQKPGNPTHTTYLVKTNKMTGYVYDDLVICNSN